MDYQSSGVNIDAGNAAVSTIQPLVKSTHHPNVLNGLGHFGAFYALPTGYKEPVLVSCTDGVGTKLKIAIDTGCLDTVGIDLVAMNVNDLICSGAKPLYFLDYIAVNALNPSEIEQIITGIVDGCKQSDCALIGGEMAEMSDMYKKGDFDLAGFAVGIVEKSKIIDGASIAPDQHVYGVASSGIHSNGFTLARKALDETALKTNGLSKKDLLTPTKIYTNLVQNLIAQNTITGIAHITGGGLLENVKRILPKTIDLVINQPAIPVLDIFNIIQKSGNIASTEMWRVFNMGIGLVIISENQIDHPALIKLGSTCAGQGVSRFA